MYIKYDRSSRRDGQGPAGHADWRLRPDRRLAAAGEAGVERLAKVLVEGIYAVRIEQSTERSHPPSGSRTSLSPLPVPDSNGATTCHGMRISCGRRTGISAGCLRADPGLHVSWALLSFSLAHTHTLSLMLLFRVPRRSTWGADPLATWCTCTHAPRRCRGLSLAVAAGNASRRDCPFAKISTSRTTFFSCLARVTRLGLTGYVGIWGP